MRPNKFIVFIAIVCAPFAVPCLNAATIPAGTTLTTSTVSLVTSQSVVGRSFEAKLAQDVSVKGHVVLKAGTKVFGKIASSRANPRKTEPQARYGHTAGTTVVNPGTRMQFQLLQPVTL